MMLLLPMSRACACRRDLVSQPRRPAVRRHQPAAVAAVRSRGRPPSMTNPNGLQSAVRCGRKSRGSVAVAERCGRDVRFGFLACGRGPGARAIAGAGGNRGTEPPPTAAPGARRRGADRAVALRPPPAATRPDRRSSRRRRSTYAYAGHCLGARSTTPRAALQEVVLLAHQRGTARRRRHHDVLHPPEAPALHRQRAASSFRFVTPVAAAGA